MPSRFFSEHGEEKSEEFSKYQDCIAVINELLPYAAKADDKQLKRLVRVESVAIVQATAGGIEFEFSGPKGKKQKTISLEQIEKFFRLSVEQYDKARDMQFLKAMLEGLSALVIADGTFFASRFFKIPLVKWVTALALALGVDSVRRGLKIVHMSHQGFIQDTKFSEAQHKEEFAPRVKQALELLRNCQRDPDNTNSFWKKINEKRQQQLECLEELESCTGDLGFVISSICGS